MVARLINPDFWANRHDKPQTKVQRAAMQVDYAWEEAGEALMVAPGPVEELIKDKVQQARALLFEVRDQLQALDTEFCDQCGGRWTDDPVHEAHCQPDKYAHDEYDAIKDALITGAVYGPVPGPTQGGNDGT